MIEIPQDAQSDRYVPRDLIPWADPYIARLLAKHRLEAALRDSLDYLRDDRAPILPEGRGLHTLPPWES